MAENSAIEWCNHTHNEWIGCTKVSASCANCYAEALMDTRYGKVKWGTGKPRQLTSEANRRKPFGWDRAAAKAGERQRVFTCSLADVFDEEAPDEWRDRLFARMALTPNLDWLVLTKRAEKMQAYMAELLAGRRDIPGAMRELRPKLSLLAANDLVFVAFRLATPDTVRSTYYWRDARPLPNVWLGVSVEDRARANERIPLLLDTPAAVRFLSVEPMIGPIDLGIGRWIHVPRGVTSATFGGGYTVAPGERITEPECVAGYACKADHRARTLIPCGDRDHRGNYLEIDERGYRALPPIDWVIVGGESGPDARPCDVAWIRSVVEQCRAASVPCFVKQLGAQPEREQGCGDCDPCNATRDRDAGERCAVPTVRIQRFLRDRKGGDPSEWPEDLRVREFPR